MGKRRLAWPAGLSGALLFAALLAACDDGGSTARTGSDATFTDGVASGDVTATSAMLWTRAEGGDRLAVEVARDPAFEDIERALTAQTSPDRDYTVLVDATELEPDTRYHYRFRAGRAVSPTGSFVTAPEPSDARPLRFVFSGDSDGSRRPDGSAPFGEFDVLRDAAAEQPDFFLYFGDTIYADRDPEARTLAEYRAKYRENRGYTALRDILGQTSLYAMWDDHEVYNDFAGATVDRARFEAGRQAFHEYLPMRLGDDESVMYRAFGWGAHADIIILDERSFRDGQASGACLVDGRADPIPAGAAPDAPDFLRGVRGFVGLPAELPSACLDTINDPARTMLGERQLEFLKEWLRESDATWKLVVNPVPMQVLLAEPYDRWEGYAAERRAILSYIRDNEIENVVFLTTDFHANVFGPVRMDPFNDVEPVAYEAIAGPIATTPLRQDIADVIGEEGADVLGGFLESLIKVDCAELDSYAYALVEIDKGGGMTITAKGPGGAQLCRTTLEPER